MRYDCGLTSLDQRAELRFFRGWYPDKDIKELLVLVHTPGIPLQWVYGALKLSSHYRRKLKLACEHAPESIRELGKENAATVEAGDGLRMLWALNAGGAHRRIRYKGQVPLWSTLELRADLRSAREIAEEFGVTSCQIRTWRTSMVFDPLTGARLVREVGNPSAGEMWRQKGARPGRRGAEPVCSMDTFQ